MECYQYGIHTSIDYLSLLVHFYAAVYIATFKYEQSSYYDGIRHFIDTFVVLVSAHVSNHCVFLI